MLLLGVLHASTLTVLWVDLLIEYVALRPVR